MVTDSVRADLESLKNGNNLNDEILKEFKKRKLIINV